MGCSHSKQALNAVPAHELNLDKLCSCFDLLDAIVESVQPEEELETKVRRILHDIITLSKPEYDIEDKEVYFRLNRILQKLNQKNRVIGKKVRYLCDVASKCIKAKLPDSFMLFGKQEDKNVEAIPVAYYFTLPEYSKLRVKSTMEIESSRSSTDVDSLSSADSSSYGFFDFMFEVDQDEPQPMEWISLPTTPQSPVCRALSEQDDMDIRERFGLPKIPSESDIGTMRASNRDLSLRRSSSRDIVVAVNVDYFPPLKAPAAIMPSQPAIPSTIPRNMTHAYNFANAMQKYLSYVPFAAADFWVPALRPDKGVFLSMICSVSRNGDMDAWGKYSRKFNFGIDEGMPGRVSRSNEPEYLMNVSTASNFVRRDGARESGLRTVIGIPFRVESEAYTGSAVALFYSTEEFDPPAQLIDFMRRMMSGATLQLMLSTPRQSSEILPEER